MSAFVLSTLLIFVAEQGDKSQLVALWFATRYRWWVVLSGVTIRKTFEPGGTMLLSFLARSAWARAIRVERSVAFPAGPSFTFVTLSGL